MNPVVQTEDLTNHHNTIASIDSIPLRYQSVNSKKDLINAIYRDMIGPEAVTGKTHDKKKTR